MRTSIETVTPALARNWLKRNISNRALRPGHVMGLAAAIKSGDFPLTHQGLAFDVDGNLLDGQHRLNAVIEANLPAKFLVVRGAARETFAYLDQGAKRNTADILSIDKRTSEVIMLLGRLVYSTKPTPSQLQTVYMEIGGISVELNEYCSSTSKLFSSSSMRLAAITAVVMGEDREYVFGLYKALVNGNVQDLPPIARSVVGQALRGDVNAQNKSDLLARGMKLFRVENSHVTRLQVMDPSVEVDAVRAFYRERMGV